MRKALFFATAALIATLAMPAFSAPSFLGSSGLILAPDDSVLDTGDFAICYRSMDLSNTVTTLGANMGVTDYLEIGIARFDPDVPGVGVDTVLSGKYRALSETPGRPSLVIGLADANGDLDPEDKPGFYAVLGKNLTPVATSFAGEPVRPLRGVIGFGSGIYKGLFAGVTWTFSDRATIVAEYINQLDIRNAISEKSLFNAALRVRITKDLQGDIAFIDGNDFAFGLSFTKSAL